MTGAGAAAGGKVSLAGTVYAYTDLRQISYTQSYLQLLIRPTVANCGEQLTPTSQANSSSEPRKVKVFFPGGGARNVHDLLHELKSRFCGGDSDERRGSSRRAHNGEQRKTRRSLGVVCDQIVEVAKEVGKSIRTPKKRTRSLSTDTSRTRTGGKRRKLSLGGGVNTLKRSESTKRKQQQQQDKENVVPPLSAVNTAPRTRTQSGTIRTVPLQTAPAFYKAGHRRPLPDKPASKLTGGDENVRPNTGTTPGGRVRMGTRMVTTVTNGPSSLDSNRSAAAAAVPPPLNSNFEGERRIHQFRLNLTDLMAEPSLSSTGHGLIVTGGGFIAESNGSNQIMSLQAGDRILAVNGVSMEQVTVPTFWRLMEKFGSEALNLIVSRQVR